MYYTAKYESETDIQTFLNFYVDPEYFKNSCKECPNYGLLYSCPPFDFDVSEYIKSFSKLKLAALKISFDKKLVNRTYSESELAAVHKNIINPERKTFDAELLLEEKNGENVALYAGSCILCESCRRIENAPCAHPEKMRYSIESLGGNAVGLARDLLGIEILWAEKGRLPEYYVLVGGVLMK